MTKNDIKDIKKNDIIILLN